MGQRECAHHAPARPRTPSPTEPQVWGHVSSGHAWLRSDHPRISVLGCPLSSTGSTCPWCGLGCFLSILGRLFLDIHELIIPGPVAGLVGREHSLDAHPALLLCPLWLHICCPCAWGISAVTHGQGTAQVAPGLKMKAFYLHLSCLEVSLFL